MKVIAQQEDVPDGVPSGASCALSPGRPDQKFARPCGPDERLFAGKDEQLITMISPWTAPTASADRARLHFDEAHAPIWDDLHP